MTWKKYTPDGDQYINSNVGVHLKEQDSTPDLTNIKHLTLTGLTLTKLNESSVILHKPISQASDGLTGYPHKFITNDSSEVSMLEHSIPSGSLGINGFISYRVRFLLQNTGNNTVNMTLRVKLGSSQLDSFTIIVANDASGNEQGLGFINGSIINSGSSASQFYSVEYDVDNMTQSTDGFSITNLYDNICRWNFSSIETNVDTTLKITMQIATAGTQYSWRLLEGTVYGPFTHN